jgi:hypothetical protein
VGTGATDKLQVAGAEGDVTFTDPLGTITFPATAGANSPMIQMFASGTGNADRMVISHSSGFTNYGLQYQDATDRFNFLSAGTNVATVDLTTQRVGIGVPAPAQKLDVSGNVQFTGTLMPGGSSGTAGQVLTSNVASTPTWTSGFLRSNYTIDFQTAAINTSTLSATGTLTGLSRAISLTAGDRVIIHAKAGIQAAVLGYGTIQLIARVNGSNLSNGTAACIGVDDDAAFCNWNTGEIISIYDVPSTASYTFTTVYFVSRVSGTLTIGGGTNSVLQGVMELQVLKP